MLHRRTLFFHVVYGPDRRTAVGKGERIACGDTRARMGTDKTNEHINLADRGPKPCTLHPDISERNIGWRSPRLH